MGETYQRSGWCSLMKWIIARNKENITWSKGFNKVVVQKGIDLENLGREPSSYLWYIIKNYDVLEGEYTFVQGNFRNHDVNILREYPKDIKDFKWHGTKTYTEDMHGGNNDTCNTAWFIKECNLKHSGEKITFKGACLFSVTAERIRKRSLEFYKKMFDVLMSEENRSPWAFERCVGLIWGNEDE